MSYLGQNVQAWVPRTNSKGVSYCKSFVHSDFTKQKLNFQLHNHQNNRHGVPNHAQVWYAPKSHKHLNE